MTFGRTTFGALYDDPARAAATSSSGASRWACSSRASCWPASASCSSGGSSSTARCTCSPRSAGGGRREPAGRGHRRRAVHRRRWSSCSRPAWSALDTYDAPQRHQHRAPGGRRRAAGPPDRLAARLRPGPPRGRVYAGQPTNWGDDFTVGDVPVFKYLESKDIDEVGYTLRTASLMTDPEYYFDDTNPGDYPLFGIGYILTPADHGAAGAGRPGRVLGRLLPVGAPRPGLHPRLRHDRRAHGDPGRRRHRRASPCWTPRSSTSSGT